MKTANSLKGYIPLILFFAFSATMFPFFYVFTRSWTELKYGIVLGLMGLELLFSVFFTVFSKKHIAKRILATVVFTAFVLVFVFAIPIFYYNTVFTIGATYSATLTTAPIALIMAVNAAVCLYSKSECKKRPVVRTAVLLLGIALAVAPYRYYLDFAKNEDSVGVYCHNANGVICVQNLIIGCKDKSVELHDTENSPYRGNNRVYANMIAGSRGILLGDDTSKSDCNVFAAKPVSGAMRLDSTKKKYSLTEWQKLGYDASSVVVPAAFTLDPRTLELTADAHGAILPGMPAADAFLPDVIGSDKLAFDLLSAKREKGVCVAGAFSTLPADGTAISVDPRCAE